ncbi:hypothetical protein J1N35_043563 [Gossypium stocksii]|uniref:Transmembrane protein n=1 Tax=Gossypium stocksii TaxID=47602 RepID=A0A9D3U7R4_9ROSI|nr:hypothetical protein J1N35_043563 [Gossypium stocksii]
MATSPPSPPSKIDLWTILSESRRMLKAHSGHFQALTVLFLLPSSCLLSIYPFIYQHFSPTIESHLSFLEQNPPIFPIKLPIFNLLYTLILTIFSFFAIGSITYSVFHGFYGRPLNLLSSFKAASTSFFPLLSTSLVTQFIVYGISLVLGLVFFALIKATQLYSSPTFILLILVYVIIFTSTVTYLQMNWIFAHAIVVVESSWGLEPLTRSRNLVKGMKGVAFKMMLLFGFFIACNIWLSIQRLGDPAGDKWKSWTFVMNIVSTSCIYMFFMLHGLAANTVFYIYAKALHGELDEEFATQYVSLPVDDGKVNVPYVVSIV